MKKIVKKAKKTLRKYSDDLGYLILTGLPIGMFHILLGKVYTLGEVF